MPNIDSDLFQLLVLLLLVGNLVALLAVLNALTSIKGDLTTGRGSGSDLSLGVAPERSYAQPAATYEPSYTGTTTSQTQPQRQEVSTGFVPMSEAVPATQEPATQSQSQAFTRSSTPELRGDEPEEQPFERDGRWWFKRGGELLVYDEGTGQWVSPGGSASAVTQTSSSFGTATSSVATAEAGEGWKCSSCGAVNGSTATTCRMCFSPR